MLVAAWWACMCVCVSRYSTDVVIAHKTWWRCPIWKQKKKKTAKKKSGKRLHMSVPSSFPSSSLFSTPPSHGYKLYLKMYEREQRAKQQRAAWHQHSYVTLLMRQGRGKGEKICICWCSDFSSALRFFRFIFPHLKFQIFSCALSKLFLSTNFYAPRFVPVTSPRPLLSISHAVTQTKGFS